MQLKHQLIHSQVTLRIKVVCTQPEGVEVVEPWTALGFGQKRPGLVFQLDHIVDEFDRNPEVIHRRAMPVTLINECNNTLT